MTDQPPTVFVVDDDDAVRDSVGMLLDTVELPFEAFPTAQDFLDSYDPSRPGCLVLDIRMPGMSGLELQQRLKELDAPIPIVFITGHGDVPMAVEAMKRGAVDFIRKPFSDDELLERIGDAMSADAGRRASADDRRRARAAVDSLTPREHEVFERVAAGQANKVVAIELGISERTVEIHRSQVMRKTGVRSLAELVRLKLSLED